VEKASAIVFAALALAAFSGAAQSAGDPKRGEEIYSRCLACHALESDRVGPHHCGVIGRRAGSVAGFDYSPAMKRAKLVWDAKSLDRFIADPARTVPGTTMTYAGVKDAKERADLIAWLAAAAHSPVCAISPAAPRR
jgi:cytochrome c